MHLLAHWSFQDGTECGMLHTLRWHASVHASVPEEPHTVTHVFGVGSCRRRRVARGFQTETDHGQYRALPYYETYARKETREMKGRESRRLTFAGPAATSPHARDQP